MTGWRLAGAPARLAGLLTVEALALGRTAVGVSMLTQPRLLPRVLGVDSAAGARMTWATQMLGAREVALGLGSFVAFRRQEPRAARLWVLAGLLSDAADALVVGTAVARGRVSRITGPVVVGIAGGAVYTQLDALQASDDA